MSTLTKNEKSALERCWREENRDAIEAYNERIAKSGMLITPRWLEEFDVSKSKEKTGR